MRFPQFCIEKMLYHCSLVFSHGFIYLFVFFSVLKELNLIHPSLYRSFFSPLVIIAVLDTLCTGPPRLFPILKDISLINTYNSNPSTDRVIGELYKFGTKDAHHDRRNCSLSALFVLLVSSFPFRNKSGNFLGNSN